MPTQHSAGIVSTSTAVAPDNPRTVGTPVFVTKEQPGYLVASPITVWSASQQVVVSAVAFTTVRPTS